MSDRFWKAEVFANGLEELITCEGFCKEIDSVNEISAIGDDVSRIATNKEDVDCA